MGGERDGGELDAEFWFWVRSGGGKACRENGGDVEEVLSELVRGISHGLAAEGNVGEGVEAVEEEVGVYGSWGCVAV